MKEKIRQAIQACIEQDIRNFIIFPLKNSMISHGGTGQMKRSRNVTMISSILTYFSRSIMRSRIRRVYGAIY